MLRGVGAVVVGFIIWSLVWLGGNSLLAAVLPGAADANPAFLVAAIVLSIPASLAAGYAAMAISKSGRTVWVLAVVLLVVGIAVELGTWNLLPLWYHAVFLVLIVPMVLYGARLRK